MRKSDRPKPPEGTREALHERTVSCPYYTKCSGHGQRRPQHLVIHPKILTWGAGVSHTHYCFNARSFSSVNSRIGCPSSRRTPLALMIKRWGMPLQCRPSGLPPFGFTTGNLTSFSFAHTIAFSSF